MAAKKEGIVQKSDEQADKEGGVGGTAGIGSQIPCPALSIGFMLAALCSKATTDLLKI